MFAGYLEILYMFAKAFVVGGLICTIAQIIINFTDWTAGKILVYFMLAGVVLQGLGLYQYLVDFAGAGATVPISGFGYLLANGAIRGAERGLFGAFTGALAAAERGRERGGDILVYHGADFQIEKQEKLTDVFHKIKIGHRKPDFLINEGDDGAKERKTSPE